MLCGFFLCVCGFGLSKEIRLAINCNDSAIFVANYPTIMQRKIYVGFSLYLYLINVKIKKKIIDDRKWG